MFIYHFLISNILLSFIILIVFLIKAFAGKGLSAQFNYKMWFFVIFLMAAVFVPNMGIPAFIHRDLGQALLNGNIGRDLSINGDIKDLYVSVNRHNILFVIWLSGFIINLLILLLGRLRLEKIMGNKAESLLFQKCCRITGVKADLYRSSHIELPMSFGIIKPVVIMPQIQLTDDSIEHIFLHELIHHKHRDILVNYIMCLLCALYWFNPFVHIMFGRIKLDMEVYCDYSVIDFTGDCVDYGNTILGLAEQRVRMKMANYFSDSKCNLKRRIAWICDYNKKSSVVLVRTVFLIMTVVTLMFSVVVNSYGYSIDKSHFNAKADYIDLNTYFKDYEGCFVLYDTHNDRYKIYNKNMAEKRVSPNSTYKIAIAINGLEEGIITPQNNEMKWDGTETPFKEWNKNHNLNSAMRYSVNWYFQNIDRGISKSKIYNYLNKISYGNKQIGFDSNYWLEGSLKISPIEQVDFLKKLYNNEFDFNRENVNSVINSIKISDNFYGKTGTGMVNGKTVNGWFVGIACSDYNTYIFAARISAENNATGLAAEKIAEDIIKDMFVPN